MAGVLLTTPTLTKVHTRSLIAVSYSTFHNTVFVRLSVRLGLALHTCAYAKDPQWTFNATRSNHVVYQSNGMCLTLNSDNTTLALDDCHAAAVETRAEFLYDPVQRRLISNYNRDRCVSWWGLSVPFCAAFITLHSVSVVIDQRLFRTATKR